MICLKLATRTGSFQVDVDATPVDCGVASINYERKPLAVPGTRNTSTNYTDSRYQLPRIDTSTASLVPVPGITTRVSLLREASYHSLLAVDTLLHLKKHPLAARRHLDDKSCAPRSSHPRMKLQVRSQCVASPRPSEFFSGTRQVKSAQVVDRDFAAEIHAFAEVFVVADQKDRSCIAF